MKSVVLFRWQCLSASKNELTLLSSFHNTWLRRIVNKFVVKINHKVAQESTEEMKMGQKRDDMESVEADLKDMDDLG